MPSAVFSRIVVGVDGTEPSFEACRQAARLVEADGSIELVAAVHIAKAAHTGSSAPRIAAELEREAEDALQAALSVAGQQATAELVNGPASESLLRALESRQATLVAVGTHGHSRASEILLGGVAGQLLHDAPCSVLVARPPADGERFPRSLVVGIDGSPQAEEALVAAESSRRCGSDAPLRIVARPGR